MHIHRKCWFDPFEEQFISPFLSDCLSLMLGIAIHCILHSQAMLERGVCELAHSFFHCFNKIFLWPYFYFFSILLESSEWSDRSSLSQDDLWPTVSTLMSESIIRRTDEWCEVLKITLIAQNEASNLSSLCRFNNVQAIPHKINNLHHTHSDPMAHVEEC